MSSESIESVAVAGLLSAAPPVWLLRVRMIDSRFSTALSLRIGTAKVLLVSPSANVNVPEVAVKSLPAVAVPPVVA